MKIILLFMVLSWTFPVLSSDVAIRSDGGSIQHGTEGLLRLRGKIVPPPELFELRQLNKALFSEAAGQKDQLRKVKYYLLNGELEVAKIHLNRIAYTQTKLKPVIYRYLAILSFVDGKFDKTLEYLSLPELKNIRHFSKICLLKSLTLIVLDKTHALEKTWDQCQQENQTQFSERNLVWLETLIQLKLEKKTGITKVPFHRLRLAALTAEEAKVMMKLALYLNQEELIIKDLPNLTVEQLQDPEVRELAGQTLFRKGSLSKAYRFVEDLKSPNAENIKGNLYLLREKFELAYPQFKLALEQKQNSHNALERLVPLAWLLGDWKNGSIYSEQIPSTAKTKFNKMTLMAAFNMQKGDYEKATRILEHIAQRSGRGTERDVTQLASFTALIQNQPEKVLKQAALSCEQYDVVNCWLLFQLTQWDAFPLTIRRNDAIPEKKVWEKLARDDVYNPLKETEYVNQLDIDELDDKLIRLIPQT